VHALVTCLPGHLNYFAGNLLATAHTCTGYTAC